MKPDSAGPLVVCRNGDCKRPAEYGNHRWCLRCWAGMKWTSIKQRVENTNGNNPSYVGVPLTFSRAELIAWVMANPPPPGMQEPSIDRIVPALGYSPGNVRWLEKRQNSRAHLADLPLDKRHCPGCRKIFPATTEFFYKNSGAGAKGFQAYCKPCHNARNSARWHADLDKNRARARELSRKPERVAAKRAYYERGKSA